jgi:hypothetical protein
MMNNQYVREFVNGFKFDYELGAITHYNHIKRNPFYRIALVPSALKHGFKCAQNWRSLMKTFEKGKMLNAQLWR